MGIFQFQAHEIGPNIIVHFSQRLAVSYFVNTLCNPKRETIYSYSWSPLFLTVTPSYKAMVVNSGQKLKFAYNIHTEHRNLINTFLVTLIVYSWCGWDRAGGGALMQ